MIELTGYRDKHEYTNKHGVKSVVYLMDCMDAMAQMGDKEFSLACVDPPYGIGFDGEVASMTISPNMNESRKKRWSGRKVNKYEKKQWDNNAPSQDYWDGLFRVSNNQIVWGGNHFTLPQSRGWIFWDKLMDIGFSLADGELAWTSFDKGVKKFTYLWAGFKKAKPEERMHPTQKPIALYDWIFHNYAKPNDTIFDSHLGSGSSRIAADKHNLPFVGVELDPDYFRDHCKRFDRYTAQLTLF